jgi:hypothetical protein
MKAQAAAEIRKILCVKKRRERLHGNMQRDQETSGPMGQVGDWVFIAFLYCLRVEMSLRCKQKFSGKEKCLLDQLSPFGTSCSPSFNSPLSMIALTAVRNKVKEFYSVTASC